MRIIPTLKLSDEDVATAMKETWKGLNEVVFQVVLPIKGSVKFTPDALPRELDNVLRISSNVINQFSAIWQGQHVIQYVRNDGNVTDQLNVYEEHVPQEMAADFWQLYARMRRYFMVADVEANLEGLDSREWGKFKKAQAEVLRKLSATTERVITSSAELHEEQEKKRAERYAALEEKLREEIENERKANEERAATEEQRLKELEQKLNELQSEFETKESHFVARQLRDKQIEQVRNWLDGWALTKGTSAKRRPIFWAYIIAVVFFGGLTAYAVINNYKILNNVDAIKQLTWWQWVLISIKAVFPLVAFSTFVIYFIRWNSSWAERHASEEFSNRSLLIDIGRSSWLLEAVRDAQERKSEIPSELLKELSNNLFSANHTPDSSIHPDAVSDILLQGLSSLRVKAPDGSEIEATRGKGKSN